jgi:polyisoprenoid-binding protein YceI
MRTQSFLPTLLIGAGALALLPFVSKVQNADAVAPTSTEVPVFVVDQVHSSVNFRVMHMQTAYATGRFNEFTGEFAFDPKALKDSKLSFEIQAGSVDTNNGKRDEHLRGSDFFSVEQFPTIKFESTRIKQEGKQLTVAGKVAWMGVEKDLAVTVDHVGEGQTRDGKKTHGFSATFTLKRSDFGINYGIEGNNLGDEVTVTLDIEAAAK